MSKYFSLFVLLLLLHSCSDSPTAPHTVPWQEINNGLPDYGFGGFHYSNVKCIAFNGNTIFAGCNEGVYTSSDDGNSWTAKNTGLPDKGLPDKPYVNCIAVKDNIVFIGTDGHGVFRSTDNGNSWISKNIELIDTNVKSIAVNDNYLYVGTGSGVFVSSNNGDNWTDNGNQWLANENAIPGTDINSIVPYENEIYVSARLFGVYKSSDNCNSWKETTGAQFWSGISPNCLAIIDNAFFVGINTGVLLSTDKGKTWTPKNKGTSLPATGTFIVKCIVGKENMLLLGTEDRGLYISTDKGENWKSVGPYKTYSPHPNPQAFYAWINSIVIHNDYVYIASNYGVHKAPLSEFR